MYIWQFFLIVLNMLLIDAKPNSNLIIKNILLEDKTKLRVMELGLMVGTKLLLKRKSIFKKTMLIIFNNSCFTINEEIAKKIEVNYA